METWGLVTYRETNLLYDPAVSSTSNKQRVCAVIAHEFAHMWFGNLVTMRCELIFRKLIKVINYFLIVSLNRVERLMVIYKINSLNSNKIEKILTGLTKVLHRTLNSKE